MEKWDLRPKSEREAAPADVPEPGDHYRARFAQDAARAERELEGKIASTCGSLVKRREELAQRLEDNEKQLEEYQAELQGLDEKIEAVRAELADHFKGGRGRPPKKVSDKLNPFIGQRAEIQEYASVLAKDVIPAIRVELASLVLRLETEIMGIFNATAQRKKKAGDAALVKLMEEREGFRIARDALIEKYQISKQAKRNMVEWSVDDAPLGMLAFR